MLTDTVYWTDDLPGFCTPLLRKYTLDKALSVMQLSQQDRDLVSKCPSWREYYANTFVVRAPIDFTLHSDGKGNLGISTALDEPWRSRAFQHLTKNLHQLLLPDVFFSDKPMKVEQLRPALVGAEVHKNIDMIQGSFDIGRWFRAMAFGFKVREGEQTVIQISRDDPLYFIKFVSDKPVVLRRFSMTPKLLGILESVFMVKNSQATFYTKMENYYRLFEERRLRKTILAEIKNNLET